MTQTKVEDGVTKKLVRWSTRKRKSGARKWFKKWVAVQPKSKSS